MTIFAGNGHATFSLRARTKDSGTQSALDWPLPNWGFRTRFLSKEQRRHQNKSDLIFCPSSRISAKSYIKFSMIWWLTLCSLLHVTLWKWTAEQSNEFCENSDTFLKLKKVGQTTIFIRVRSCLLICIAWSVQNHFSISCLQISLMFVIVVIRIWNLVFSFVQNGY